MKCIFLGVGEACDAMHGNSSILVYSGTVSVLLDCGFSVPHVYFALENDPDKLDAVWISHFHGDHFFGLPLLLLRFWEMKRRTPLHIISQRGIREKTESALELAYPGFTDKLCYPLKFHELHTGESRMIAELSWQGAESEHGQRNLALRLDNGYHALFYSGDGRPSSASIALAENCGLAIHEAFRMSDQIPGHGSIESCLAFAEHANIPALALLHLERNFRTNEGEAIRRILDQAPCKAVLAEENMIIDLQNTGHDK